MEIYIFAMVILVALAIFDLVVGVSNDAANFLNSSLGSKVAPRHVIMIIASLGMLAGVTFSSGMMEVARKGIFHPQYFVMPELMFIFLAVMLTDILLLDLFNTFGLPTSTTVSIVFELLGAAVAVSLWKINASDQNYAELVNYINTAKALSIISGILLSVVLAFVCGAIVQFFSRLLFTFDYMPRLKRYGGFWGGFTLSFITYFILIKGAKGTSFLSPETVTWINTHAGTIFAVSFLFFGILFQLLSVFTKINILKPIILVGTFALSMAFAANDLVNFIGVPLAGIEAFSVAAATADPMHVSMAALQKKVQTSTWMLLCAGTIMVVTLWISKKARTVSQTEISLGRQEEGVERFGSFALSRGIVGMITASFDLIYRRLPTRLRRKMARRLDATVYKPARLGKKDKTPAFDLLRASVNLMVASAVISYATSMKLPLSTTYVTFMVAMGTSLSDQAWGRENAVYRVTGVLAVIAGWFCTAFTAFTIAFLFASALYVFGFYAMIVSILLVGFTISKTFRYHAKRTEDDGHFEVLHLKEGVKAPYAVNTSFKQTGHFLNEISQALRDCFEALFSEDRRRLKDVKNQQARLQTLADKIIANIFKTLYLLDKEDVETTRKYAKTVGAIQTLAESCSDIIVRANDHLLNYHQGFFEAQIEELRQVKISVNRLLENTAIMLLKRKRVDYDYIDNQCSRLNALIYEINKKQIKRIQKVESTTRLNILFYVILENSEKIAVETQNLLDIFKEYFQLDE